MFKNQVLILRVLRVLRVKLNRIFAVNLDVYGEFSEHLGLYLGSAHGPLSRALYQEYSFVPFLKQPISAE